jgi:DNA topoisomerase-1
MDIIQNITTPEYDELAKQANLRYISDTKPGFTREKKGEKFIYLDKENKIITDQEILDRITNLRIPPAWIAVWISPTANGHIQATGRDEKGRKQYIYHPKWHELASETKFNKMIYFSEVLPEIRAKIDQDMLISSLSQERVLATIVWLLDNTYIRIGNEEYAQENNHYGLTTLRNKHVTTEGSEVIFEFTGKSGKKHKVGVSHQRVARTIRRLEEIPGYELFQYLDEEGQRHPIDSQDVNDYLRSLTGESISAKDFRTWGGTTISAKTLTKIGDYETNGELKTNIKTAVTTVSSHLGNTPTVCRSYYIHPTIIKTYTNKQLIPFFSTNTKVIKGLQKSESATKELLKEFSEI